jgi:His-Xaa-Ser system protein HxsD
MPEIIVEFDAELYSADVLNAAAYRCIGSATCRLEKGPTKFLCNLGGTKPDADLEAIRIQFINLANDERLRSSLEATTRPMRNVILSLAFGSLAKHSDTVS